MIGDMDSQISDTERRMAAVIERLTKAGYKDTFRGEKDGVRAVCSGHVHQPPELRIDAIERFEGASDPDDQVIVLAISSEVDDCRGTYTVPYGKNMPVIDSDLIAKMPDKRERH
jgi:hypothetical protein